MANWILKPFATVSKLIFWRRDGDFEKKLKYLSKEEVTVLSRIKKRTSRWRKLARFLVIYSVSIQFFVICFAVFAVRNRDVSLRFRVISVSLVLVFPLVSYLVYSCCAGFTRIRDKADSQILEKLRSERRLKIDELKEKTNYYATQQLIHRFDPDPTAKAAAASVLVSKLSSEDKAAGIDDDRGVEQGSSIEQIGGGMQEGTGLGNLRQRRVRREKGRSAHTFEDANFDKTPEQTLMGRESGGNNFRGHSSSEVESVCEREGSDSGGWLARIAAMLVGEDPAQCYALICENCHMHNGLARKEDFPYITYHCPRCRHLNKSKNFLEVEEDSRSMCLPDRNSSSPNSEVQNLKGVSPSLPLQAKSENS